MKWLSKACRSLNLLEHGANRLSLTNLALLVILGKIVFSEFDWIGAATLLPVIASYMHKRHEVAKAKQAESEHALLADRLEVVEGLLANKAEQDKALADLTSYVKGMQLKESFTPRRQM